MDDKLTNEERTLFDSLSKEASPPSFLEEKIVNELKEKSLINESDMKMTNMKPWIAGIAASILFFVSGYYTGNSGTDEVAEISSGYILLLHEDERFQPDGGEIEIFAEYAAWMGKMMLSGISITGNELSPETTTWVSSQNEKIEESTDKISGYFIIGVEDRVKAQEIALSSPHIKYGGTVELIKLSERN
ncbi:MAG: hypothetical protein ABJF11_09105 [Reichenbachiella sp.]|uniref:hypothetical protein n=1 Tax=Reichenbachiella sp. TaxID=2184521 RepID=UPI003266C62F